MDKKADGVLNLDPRGPGKVDLPANEFRFSMTPQRFLKLDSMAFSTNFCILSSVEEDASLCFHLLLGFGNHMDASKFRPLCQVTKNVFCLASEDSTTPLTCHLLFASEKELLWNPLC
ncbi:hypothetical protein TNCV_1959731 [Trichonephila clavipes]|nr:hypothetical protein TNCV_1959731 [Trichonephila clavipes]